MSSKYTGGQAVTESLRALGASIVFGVSGNQILPIYDTARDSGLRMIHMRHESASAFAAAGMAEMTGHPGVLLTSAGPAFLAALTGVAVIRAMELPLIFLSGASPIHDSGYGNFQELDQATTCRSVCKASFSATNVEAIPTVLSEAWQLTLQGIPGPVHVGLPADVLLATGARVPVPNVAAVYDRRHFQASAELRGLVSILLESSRPMLIARPHAARGRAAELLSRLSNNLGVKPLLTGPPRGLADARYAHVLPHYKRSDCVLLIGPSDYSVGFLDESIIAEHGNVLLVDAEGDPKPRRQPAVHTRTAVLDALEYLVAATTSFKVRDPEWFQLWSTPLEPEPRPQAHPGRVHPLEVAAQIRDILQPDDVLCVDGG